MCEFVFVSYKKGSQHFNQKHWIKLRSALITENFLLNLKPLLFAEVLTRTLYNIGIIHIMHRFKVSNNFTSYKTRQP